MRNGDDLILRTTMFLRIKLIRNAAIECNTAAIKNNINTCHMLPADVVMEGLNA